MARPAAAGARRSGRRRGRGRRAVVAALATVLVLGAGAAVMVLSDGESPRAAPTAPDEVRVDPEDTSATATWVGGRGTAYRVQYSRDLDFAGARTEQVEKNQLALESLDPGTTYFLRVVSVRDGKASRPSRLVRFTTEFRYPAPRLVVDSRTSRTLSPRWTSDVEKGDDVEYEVQLDRDEAFEDPRSRTVAKRRTTFRKLSYKATYSVRVRVVEGDVPLSPWSATETRQTSRKAPLRVGSYNVLKSARANWGARRTAVAETIRSQELDVVGLQEATPASVAGGVRQYADIVRVLGPDWALTEDSTGPTGEVRTVYDRTKVELLEHGYEEIPGSTRFGVMRYITWAIFEQKSTGKQFVFLNTHFITTKARSRFGPRAAAAAQMVRVAKRVSKDGALPVIIAGDFNSAAHRDGSNGVYRAITGGGYLDPLVPGRKKGSAERTVNADLKTVNKYARTPRRDAWAPMIDHMFVSPMRVKEWETVARLDGSGRFVGTIPSDHNMIRLTVFLP